MRRLLLTMALAVFLPAGAEAAGSGYLDNALQDQAPAAAAHHPSTAGSALRAVCALAVVVALIVITSHAARRFLPARMLSGPDKLISVVECEYLAPKSRLFLVSAAGEYLLLSLDHSGTRFLARIDPGNVKAFLEKKAPAAAPHDFGSVMGGFLKQFEGKHKNETAPGVSADIRDIHKEIEKLKALRDDLKA